MEKSRETSDSRAVGGERGKPMFHQSLCGHIKKHRVGRRGPKGEAQEEETPQCSSNRINREQLLTHCVSQNPSA